MPKVFLVTATFNSTSTVEGVFPNRSKAELYMAELNECRDKYGPTYSIQELPLGRPDRVRKKAWVCRIDLATEAVSRESFDGMPAYAMVPAATTHEVGQPIREAWAVSYLSQAHADELAKASYDAWKATPPKVRKRS